MFNFVCKSSSFVRHWRHCISSTTHGAPPAQAIQQCLSWLSNRCISTAETSKQQSLTVSCLINTYGSSPKSALLFSNKFQLKTPERVDAGISFFKSHGFSHTHISKIIKSCPDTLLYDHDRTFLPKMEFFYSKGFLGYDLANVLSKCPFLFRRSLEKHIIPTFNYLSDLFESQEKGIVSIKRRPFLLYNDLQTYWAPQVSILLVYGVTKSNIVMSMSNWFYSSVIGKKEFKEVVEEVKEMGFNTLRSHFILAVSLKSGMSRSLWESKVNVYKKWGRSEEEFLEAFRKDPRIMVLSKDKIMAAMDFFVNKMGLESSYMAKNPMFVSYSLQRRVIPRATVFQFLLTKCLIKSNYTSLNALLRYSEKAFLERFVNSYDEAPQLL